MAQMFVLLNLQNFFPFFCNTIDSEMTTDHSKLIHCCVEALDCFDPEGVAAEEHIADYLQCQQVGQQAEEYPIGSYAVIGGWVGARRNMRKEVGKDMPIVSSL